MHDAVQQNMAAGADKSAEKGFPPGYGGGIVLRDMPGSFRPKSERYWPD